MPSLSVDYAVVGSSPLLIMLALKLRRAGFTVALIEREETLGGAWQTEEVDGIGRVECACHLVEWYWRGYEDLSELSGMDFVVSAPLPARVYKDGARVPYTSRGSIAKAFYLEMRALVAAVIRWVISRREARHGRSKIVMIRIASFIFYMRSRFLGLFLFDKVRQPAGGYTAFIDGLIDNLENCGVKIFVGNAAGIDENGDLPIVRVNDVEIEAATIYVGDAVQLVGELDNFEDGKNYYHMIVGVGASSVLERNSYLHFPDDDLFHRVTYIKDHVFSEDHSEALYLLQLRKSVDQYDDSVLAINELFVRCGIIAASTRLTVHKVFSKFYQRRSLRSESVSARSSIVQRLRTGGDLSRSVVLERDLFRSIAPRQLGGRHTR